MDQNPGVFDEKKKSNILKILAQLLIDGYGNNKIAYFEMKKAATYILDHIDEIQSEKDLVYFLENLSAYWQIFNNVLVLEKKDTVKAQEDLVIQKLSQYIKNSSA
jgi:hypothetical protein